MIPTWFDVSHAWNQFQVFRVDTGSWTIAQTQHKLMAVLLFS